MDDVPSQNRDRGIFDVGSDFAPIFREIAKGVKTVTTKGMDRRRSEDVFQDVSLDAWKIYCSEPAYFTDGKPREWARHAASNDRKDYERKDRSEASLKEALMREVLTGTYDQKALDVEFEDAERRRAVSRAFELLSPHQRAVGEAFFFDGRSRRETAIELGLSERVVKRTLLKLPGILRRLLADWNPDASDHTRKRGDHA